MNDDDKKEFAEIMEVLADEFGGTISKMNLRLKFRALAEYSIEQIQQAALGIIREKMYPGMPRVSEFIAQIEGTETDQAEAEAQKVLRAIKQYGTRYSVVFDDPHTQAVVQSRGGWVALCSTLLDSEIKWFVREFRESYTSYSRKNIVHHGVLPGRYENGELALIGDATKCRQIMETKSLPGNVVRLLENIG